MIYFGCIDSLGHFLFRPDMHSSSREVEALLSRAGIYPKCDGGFCPGVEQDERHPWKRPNDQPEGAAKLTHHEGWTVLSFWDRSVDHRKGSSSTFLEQGELSFDEMVEMAKLEFPKVWARFAFEIVDKG